MSQEVKQIETIDGKICGTDSAPDHLDNSLTVATILDGGLNTIDETTLLSLPPTEVEKLRDDITNRSDDELSIIIEIHERLRDNYALGHNIDGENIRIEWARTRDDAEEEWYNRHSRHMNPIARYQSTDGVPASNGAVATRILKGWVVEFKIYDPDTIHPDLRTVVGKAIERFRINEECIGFRGRLSDERAWRFEALNKDDGETFALAPLEEGEDLTFWVHNSFRDEWGEPFGVCDLQTWPDKWSWMNSD